VLNLNFSNFFNVQVGEKGGGGRGHYTQLKALIDLSKYTKFHNAGVKHVETRTSEKIELSVSLSIGSKPILTLWEITALFSLILLIFAIFVLLRFRLKVMMDYCSAMNSELNDVCLVDVSLVAPFLKN